MIRNTSAMDKPVAEEPRRTASRNLILGGVALALIVLLALAVPALSRWARADRAIEPSRIRVGAISRGDLERDVSAQGRIVAALHPTLFSPAQGTVALSVRAGTDVTKGQLLATVESPELVSRLVQERSTFQSLQSELGRSQIAARQSALRNKQAVD